MNDIFKCFLGAIIFIAPIYVQKFLTKLFQKKKDNKNDKLI